MNIAIKVLLSGLASVLLFALGSSSIAATESGHGHGRSHWGYEGEAGPDHWGSLQTDYAACGDGNQQSPIDIISADAVEADVGKIRFDYHKSKLRIINNGHTIQVNIEPGSSIGIDGEKFDLLQLHFHTPSEHMINSRHLDMEAHFVHKNSAGQLAVIGVMMDKGRGHIALQSIWDHAPSEVNKEVMVDRVMFDPASLLPGDADEFYRYQGSLTTPPCSEIVNWFVLKNTINVSDHQVSQFAHAIGENARPVQALHRRFVLEQD